MAEKKTPKKKQDKPAPKESGKVDLSKYDPVETEHPIDELVFDPENPKRHPKRNLEQVRALLDKYGQLERLVIQKGTNIVIGGNGRLQIMKAMTKAGDKRFATIRTIDITINDTERRFLSVALNRSSELGEWDNVRLAEVLSLAQTKGIPESMTGFITPEIERLVDRAMLAAKSVNLGSKNVQSGSEGGDASDADAEDIIAAAAAEAENVGLPTERPKSPELAAVGGGILKLNPDVQFPSDLIFELPELRRDMLGKCPEPILCWTGADKTGQGVHIDCEHYFLVWGTCHKPPDWSKCVVGFYIDDDKFDECWYSPDVFAAKMLSHKPHAIVSPNFSPLWEMNTAERIYLVHRTRWVSRFWQEAGLKVIPDIITGTWRRKDWEYIWAGIPQGCPCASMQLQTSRGWEDQARVGMNRDNLRAALDIIQPKSLIIYGDMAPAKREELLDGIFPAKFPLIAVRDWTSRRLRTKNVTSKEQALATASADE